MEYVLNAYLSRSKECMPVIESLASTVDPNHPVLAPMVRTSRRTAHAFSPVHYHVLTLCCVVWTQLRFLNMRVDR
eukprot:COSAG02_NODE_385_length_23394_cov_43.838807_10_plen_75_part_00